MSLIDTMLSGRERNAEALAKHTMTGVDWILNGSPKRTAVSSAIPEPQQPMCRCPDLVEGSSPCADLGTAEVSVSQYRRMHVEHERFVGHVLQLLKDARFEAALDAVQSEYDALHGPRG